MANLTRSEQEINSDIFSKEKIINKFFSFSEAEKQIHRLKNNYIEIKDVKSKICTIIDIDNIKKYEEILFDIPNFFDDLSKAAFLILEDLKIYEQKNKKLIKKESRDNLRKIPDVFLNSKPLFKTANDTAVSINKIKNKNNNFRYNDKKRTDLSVKIKDLITFSENNDDSNSNFGNSKQKLTAIKNEKKTHLNDNKRKTSEIKLHKNNYANGTDSSRFTPKNLKLPRIINNDKEKRNINFLSQYSEDIKRSVEIHKSSVLSRKNYK